MASNAATHLVDTDDHSHDHPSDRKYIEIAVILTVITLAEVAIYYIDWMHESGALVPTLIVMSLAKFVTVIGYYMHLKFDAAAVQVHLRGRFAGFNCCYRCGRGAHRDAPDRSRHKPFAVAPEFVRKEFAVPVRCSEQRLR